MADLPLAPFERIIKRAGGRRVAEGAKEKMREVLEDYAIELARSANDFAKHANRKTITGEDIALAAKEKKKNS